MAQPEILAENIRKFAKNLDSTMPVESANLIKTHWFLKPGFSRHVTILNHSNLYVPGKEWFTN